jgi:hypothetical protein
LHYDVLPKRVNGRGRIAVSSLVVDPYRPGAICDVCRVLFEVDIAVSETVRRAGIYLFFVGTVEVADCQDGLDGPKTESKRFALDRVFVDVLPSLLSNEADVTSVLSFADSGGEMAADPENQVVVGAMRNYEMVAKGFWLDGKYLWVFVIR